MFIQLQVYWRGKVNYAPKEIILGEVFHCHDLDDLYTAKQWLSSKADVLVYRLERDGDDMCMTKIDLDDFIREQEATEHHDRASYNRAQSRKLTTEAAE